MSGTPNKEKWLREAEQAFERIFGNHNQLGEGGRSLTFTEIETEAVREGNQLARWLLEGKVSREAETSDCHGEEFPCPFCENPAKRVSEDPENREICARPGAVSFKRYKHYCIPCRRLFFSAGPQAEPQD